MIKYFWQLLFFTLCATSITSFAQTGNPALGRTLFESNCSGCHAGAPNFDARVNRAANNVGVLNSAINNVNAMQFLTFLSAEDKANIVAYIANPNGSGPTQQAQTITFPILNSFVWNSAGLTLNATASSALPVSYAVQFGSCTITNNQLTAFGTGSCTIAASQAGNASFSAAPQVTRTVTIGVGDFSDMWWAGSTQNGWGMSVQQHGTTQFNAIYVYDTEGKARWFVMPGGTWNSNFTTYSGLVYQPTSAPFNAYDKTQFRVPPAAGTVTLSYQANGTMNLTHNINGISGANAAKTMERQPFAGNTSPFKANDLWWGGVAEDGWGINIAQQQGNLFAVWYTYGADGKATWFVMPGGAWTGNAYEGKLYATTGSSWFGVYDPARVIVTEVGTLKFAFTDIVNGAAQKAAMTYTMTLPVPVTQTKNIERQPF
jgi:hypothetical protein